MNSSMTENLPKVYRGAYTYHKGDSVYCEETFEVYKNAKELTLTFISESLARVVTGELLKYNVTYIASKNWLPKKVTIEKSLGSNFSKEIFDYHERTNTINYTFKNKSSENREKIQTPPRFHVTTPTIASAYLFLLSKKFDNTTRNDYTLLSSDNLWQYMKPPATKSIYLVKPVTGMIDVDLDGKKVRANHYKLFDGENSLEDGSTPPSIDIYISKHVAIPYMVESDGIKIKVKYLNDLSGAAE